MDKVGKVDKVDKLDEVDKVNKVNKNMDKVAGPSGGRRDSPAICMFDMSTLILCSVKVAFELFFLTFAHASKEVWLLPGRGGSAVAHCEGGDLGEGG